MIGYLTFKFCTGAEAGVSRYSAAKLRSSAAGGHLLQIRAGVLHHHGEAVQTSSENPLRLTKIS
jgi:hypothetical protein